MQYRPLGASGIEASVVGLGAWAIGGWLWGGTNESDAIAAIRAAIDEGINLVDTAPVYGYGLSEQIVGKAIAGRREKVVLATKCGLLWDRQKIDFSLYRDGKDRTKAPSIVEVNDLSGRSIREEVELSLRRLGTDYIDLYQTHWQDPSTPIPETMACLCKLRDEGKIRAIGVSNATLQQIEEYRAVGVLDSDQEPYSMIDRRIGAERLPYCRRNNIAVLAYSPLAQGLLTGKVGPDRTFADGDMRRGSRRFSMDNRRRLAEMLAEFQPVAERHGITLAQLTIAWTVAQPGLTHALCGARNPQQAIENAVGGKVTLSNEDLRTIDAAIESHAAEIV